jgi:hypothetical protein
MLEIDALGVGFVGVFCPAKPDGLDAVSAVMMRLGNLRAGFFTRTRVTSSWSSTNSSIVVAFPARNSTVIRRLDA